MINEENTTENTGALPPNVEVVKGRWWIKYLITVGVLAVIAVLVAWARGAFGPISQTELAELKITELQCRMRQWSDAFFVSGVLGLGFGLIIVASNGGAFDMIAYGFRALFSVFKKDPVDRKYATFYDYRKAREKKKRSFWYLVIVGGAFVLVSVAFTLAFYYA